MALMTRTTALHSRHLLLRRRTSEQRADRDTVLVRAGPHTAPQLRRPPGRQRGRLGRHRGRVHHVQVRIPFYNLKHALEGIKSVYGDYVIERKSLFRDYFRATMKCKLFDPEKGHWLSYREGRQAALGAPVASS